MFEDFKDKIREQSKDKQKEDVSLSPEVLKKFKKQGLGPRITITTTQ